MRYPAAAVDGRQSAVRQLVRSQARGAGGGVNRLAALLSGEWNALDG
ncbi:MAG: hypothetical protein ACLR0U_25320 [Enterocloster clostridioformis]